MARLTGGQAVIEGLEREGVDVVFGIPGVHTLEIYDALIDSDIDHVTTRHEQGAGFMADGYARATGRVGVALVITGPGLTNAATPIGQAYSDSSPVLVISSNNPTTEADRGKGLLHELKDQQGVMENLAERSERLTRVSEIPDAIAEAFDDFETSRPRPIHLELATDVLEREEEVPDPPAEREPAAPPSPDRERIEAAADRLASADDPLLILGGGATGAAAEARRLVDATDIPVVTTVAGKGVVPEDHDLSLGARMRTGAVGEFVESRDVVLAVGTELSPMDTGEIDLPETVVHVDLDYENFGKNQPVDVGIVADAAESLAALGDALEDRDVRFGEDGREQVAALKPDPLETTAAAGDDRHRILAVLQDTLDDDAVIVNDMTKLSYEARSALPVREPGTFHFPRGFGTLGFAPPAAYGAAVGVDDRQVVALVGDGGVMFTVQELATAVKYDLALPVIVLNDDSYDVVRLTQVEQYDGRTLGTDIDNPQFVEMARTFGAAARRVDMDDVETALPGELSEAFERDRPTVIEIPVDF